MRFGWIVGLALGLIFSTGGALAQADLTGLYAGTGEFEGVTLRLFSNSELVSGDLGGGPLASFVVAGKSDDDSAAAFLSDKDPNTPDIIASLQWEGDVYTLRLSSEGKLLEIPLQRVRPGDAGVRQPPELFFAIEGERVGPLSPEEILARIDAGEIDGRTLTWTPGQAEWTAAGDNPMLAPIMPTGDWRGETYFVVENGAQVGPFSETEMLERIRSGATVRGDLVWYEGLPEWMPIEEVGQFAALVAPPIPQPPPLPKPPPLPVDEAGLAAELRALMVKQVPDATPQQIDALTECYLPKIAVLTPDEWAMVTDGDSNLTADELEGINTAHPGFSESLNECAEIERSVREAMIPALPAEPVPPAIPATPSSTDAPAKAPADAELAGAVLAYLKSHPSERAGGRNAEQTQLACIMEGLAEADLSAADRQMLIDTGFNPRTPDRSCNATRGCRKRSRRVS